jgi:NADH-quinone oxidoreductase subunit A
MAVQAGAPSPVAPVLSSPTRGFRVADYSALLVYLALGAGLAVFLVFISGKLSPRNPSPAKLRPYECGVSEPQTTEARWPVHFALVAMLFLVFDVEALFFYPWAVLARELRWTGILAIGAFFAVLGVGYIYARARGALRWR